MTDGHARLDGRAPTGDPAPTGVVAGIDIGGTKIATLIVGPDGSVRGRATHPASIADQDGAVDAIVACLDAALAAADLARDDLDAIGVGVPGRVDPEIGHVTLAVNLDWTDFALRDALEAATGRPVLVENDARAAAIGLHTGIHGDGGDLAYLAVGTGIAAGIVLDGRIHRGAHGLAGEIGHAIVDPDGPDCACGQSGCLESLASGPSIARRAVELGADPGTTAVEAYRAAADGQHWAVGLAADVGQRLAWAIHTLALAYDVERVVVGGGVSHAGRPFSDPLQRELARIRRTSGLAETVIPASVDVLPPEAEPGAWGAVAIARGASATTTAPGDATRTADAPAPTATTTTTAPADHPPPGVAQGSEVVGHV